MRFASIMIGLGFSAALSFVAYLAIFDTPYYSRLDCSRAQDVCTVQQITIAHSRPSWSLPLSDIRGADARTFPARRGAPRISVYLLTAKDAYYFADYSKHDRAQNDAQRTRQFLNSSDAALSVVVDDRTSFYVIAIGLAIVLALLVTLWRVLLRITFERKLASTLPVDTPAAAS